MDDYPIGPRPLSDRYGNRGRQVPHHSGRRRGIVFWGRSGYILLQRVEIDGTGSYVYSAWAIRLDHYVTAGADPNALDGASLYGQFIMMLGNLQASIAATTTRGAAAAAADRDLTFPDADSRTVSRLREGIERFFITDINNPAASAQAQSEIVMMWDQVSTNVDEFNHIPGGSNSLYMDGHVGFTRYPSQEHPVNGTMGYINGVLF